MASVDFRGVVKQYPDGTLAVDNFNLHIDDGELVVLVGPSGCGKSTLLRSIAGLEEITAGELLIGDRVVNDVDARERDIAMVFQNYALYPHMTIFENIAFPLRTRRVSREEIRARVARVAELLEFAELLKRKPGTLSGGQRQRVAMGRAIIREPQVFLMDEPLSNLDAKLRVHMRAEIAKLQQRLGVTTVYVTHDQVEAMTMGRRIAVMRKGRLQQVGPPQHVYDSPANLFVATFIGSPSMNLLRGHLERTDGGLVCRVGLQDWHLDDLVVRRLPALAGYTGQDIAIGIRPERLLLADQAMGPVFLLRSDVQLVEALGSDLLVHVFVHVAPVLTDEVIEVAKDVDAGIASALENDAPAAMTTMVARLPVNTTLVVGEAIELAVAPEDLYFFDLDGGRAIQ